MLGRVLKQNKLTFSLILFKNCVFLLRDGFELTMIHLRTRPDSLLFFKLNRFIQKKTRHRDDIET